MTYARLWGRTIVAEQDQLPEQAMRPNGGGWVYNLPSQSVEVQRSTGWYQVQTTTRPADTPTHTYVRSLALVSGGPTEVWTAELASAYDQWFVAAGDTEAVIRQRSPAFIPLLRAIEGGLGTYPVAVLSQSVRTLALALADVLALIHKPADD